MSKTTLEAQPIIKSLLQSKEVVERSKMWYYYIKVHACIALNAVNST